MCTPQPSLFTLAATSATAMPPATRTDATRENRLAPLSLKAERTYCLTQRLCELTPAAKLWDHATYDSKFSGTSLYIAWTRPPPAGVGSLDSRNLGPTLADPCNV